MSSAASDNASNEFSQVEEYQDEQQPYRRVLYTLPHRVSAQRFVSETSQNERDILRFEVNCALQHFLELDRAIFLEGLGIVFPSAEERVRGYPHSNSLVVRREVVRRISFEKCDDTISLNPDNFPNMAQTREVAQRVYPRLPLDFHLGWSEQGIRGLLKGYFAYIRENLITKGYSNELSAFGTLYALHNRQGKDASDRFAGADILLHRRRAQIVRLISTQAFDRPVLETSFEPIIAAYGEPLAKAEVDFTLPLIEMGLKDELPSNIPEKFEVAIFPTNHSGNERWLIATNGLRKLGSSTVHKLGTELMVQLPRIVGSQPKDCLDKNNLGMRMLSLGWLLAASSKTKSLKAGVGLNVEGPIIPDYKTNLEAVLATRSKLLNGRHLATDSEFTFLNLVGITKKEAELFARDRKTQLLALLSIKGLDQVTYPTRGCLLSKSEIE